MLKYLEQLDFKEAKELLRLLAKEDKELAKRIEKTAKNILSDINEDDVVKEVYQALERLTVDDIYNRPSDTPRYRYQEPVVAAYEILEETLEPFEQQILKFRKLAMHPEAAKAGVGLAKGIIKFLEESDSDFKEWVQDDTWDWLGGLISDWEKECTDQIEKEGIREMKQLLGE